MRIITILNFVMKFTNSTLAVRRSSNPCKWNLRSSTEAQHL